MNTKRTILERKIAVQSCTGPRKMSYGGPQKELVISSEIRMRGNWLRKLGFEPGTKALITCHDKKLIITAQENK
jgi:hypothetical protein